ncbi:MAG: DUF3365 domain-containing protein [Desulfobacteraceae bacterium]
MDSFKIADSSPSPIRIKPYILALTLVWTAVTTLSLVWNITHIKQDSLNLAIIQARESIKKDVLYRRWNARHGGVYAPITESTPANPYLNIPKRDIYVDSNLVLTMINPAYMTRQVYEMAVEESGVRGHITSLDPIRPENAPDPWEIKALDTFERGDREFWSVETMQGIECLRLMRPLVTEQSCLKCHADQGYRTGDVRGGISVSVPVAPFLTEAQSHIIRTSIGYGLLWGVGLVLIGFGMYHLNRQLTEHHRHATNALMESEEKYRSMMEAMNDAAYICSPDFRIEYQNSAMVKRIGRDATGEICHQVINSLDEKCPWCAMEKIQQGIIDKKEVKSPMDDRYYQVSSSPILHRDGTISKMTIYTDISQIKQAEAQLRQAQKLEALGNLAGGIAHDFNNILSPIIGLSEMLIADLPADSYERENAVDILKSAKRASDLVQQILSFSRQTEPKRVPLRIQQILKEVFKLMRSTIPVNISIDQSIQTECGQVLANPIQVHQIAMNLITNAYHAVEENGGGIFVSLKETTIAETVPADLSLKPGRYAMMSVADTGCGIDPAILDKIFEPYFTTKTLGKGTGLGLAVVYGIVKDHGGNIRVKSRPGKGTSFDILLPIIDSEDETDSEVKKATLLPVGNEHILLVDDEKSILKIERVILQRLGYQVTISNSSTEALAIFKAQPDAFDLVITDMTMPDMTGDQLTRAMLEIRPDLSIIICTGFSEKIDPRKADAIGIKGFLMKPIIKAKMAKMVRKILDQAKENESSNSN